MVRIFMGKPSQKQFSRREEKWFLAKEKPIFVDNLDTTGLCKF